MSLLPSLSLSTLLARAIVLMTAMPVHEAAHAYVAEKMGDSTARYNHRMTLNPFDHVDPLGAVMILLFGVGFARPVPVNSGSFRNRKLGMFLTSIAGPVSNILLALVVLAMWKIAYIAYALTGLRILYGACKVFAIMTSTNLSLAVFNLIPIPPLDGWHAIMPFLPYQWTWKISRYEQQIVWGVLLLVWLGFFDGIISGGVSLLYNLIDSLTGFLDVFMRVVR